MNKATKISLAAGGGLVGFTLAYVAFALALGVQPHQIPVAGAIFPAPPAAAGEEQHLGTAAVEPQPASVAPTRIASAGLLDVFQIDSPFSAGELETLVGELKRRSRELEDQSRVIGERERRSAERAEFLDEQFLQLQRLRTGLESWETELEQRAAELDDADQARTARESDSWARMAKLFADGDAADSGKRLAGYPPEDAARILHQLKPARAKELLDNVGAEKWKEYAEAYRTLATPAAQ